MSLSPFLRMGAAGARFGRADLERSGAGALAAAGDADAAEAALPAPVPAAGAGAGAAPSWIAAEASYKRGL